MFFFDLIGLISFALSGYLSATRAKLDILGVFIISFSTALAGGLLRDISINKTPFIFQENYPLFTIIFVILIAISFRLHKYNIENHFLFILSDTIGLVSFSISGALMANFMHLNYTSFILLSLVTATGGGVIRDLLLQKKISLLRYDIYGTFSIFIGTFIYFFNEQYIYTLFTISVLLRFIVLKYNISLPNFNY